MIIYTTLIIYCYKETDAIRLVMEMFVELINGTSKIG